uniref:Uncharacterized protein n=1 Tax=Pfiesteria piscicida TaxID=71001 RepID=E8Z659_PFIPI|nr:unknown [Pfiesteria piscicida]
MSCLYFPQDSAGVSSEGVRVMTVEVGSPEKKISSNGHPLFVTAGHILLIAVYLGCPAVIDCIWRSHQFPSFLALQLLQINREVIHGWFMLCLDSYSRGIPPLVKTCFLVTLLCYLYVLTKDYVLWPSSLDSNVCFL